MNDEERTKKRAQEKAWREANPDKVRAKNKRYYDANRERVRVLHSSYREANRQKFLTYQKARNANKRARLLGNEDRITTKDVRRIFEVQEGLCFYCGKRLGDDWQIDHRTPFCRGGSNDPSNVVCCCKKCNLRKMTRTSDEFFF